MQYLFFHTFGTTDLLQHSPVPHFKNFQVYLIYFPWCPSVSTIQAVLQMFFISFRPKFKYNLLLTNWVFSWNAEILGLISLVHLAPIVISLPTKFYIFRLLMKATHARAHTHTHTITCILCRLSHV